MMNGMVAPWRLERARFNSANGCGEAPVVNQLLSAYWPPRRNAGSVATLTPYEGVNDARCNDPDR